MPSPFPSPCIEAPPAARAEGRPDPWAAGEGSALHAEWRLLDAVQRLGRSQVAAGWTLLILHLSRLSAEPAAAQQRARIGTFVLDDAASRGDGQVFALADGDLALLFRPADAGAALAASLGRLFAATRGEAAALRTLFPLPQALAPATEELRARLAAPRPPAHPLAEAPANPTQRATAEAASLQAAAATAPLDELMQRHTGILLRRGPAQPLLPLYRELSLSLPSLADLAGLPSLAGADPFLLAHVAARLDRRVLQHLQQDVPGQGLWSGGLAGAALHVNLSVRGILSADYAALARCAAAVPGLRVAIEVPVLDAFDDPAGAILARERLHLAGMDLVLDQVQPAMLPLTTLRALRPALVKLSWSDTLRRSGTDGLAALQRLGAERTVLMDAASETAVIWGLGHGIRRFQGPYVDAMLAAARLRACSVGAGRCSVRHCAARAQAVSHIVRDGCWALPLLDASAPQGPP